MYRVPHFNQLQLVSVFHRVVNKSNSDYNIVRHKMVKDQKPGTTARVLADKTPLPNRIGTTPFQTPFPQKKDFKSSKLAFIDPDTLNQTKSVENGLESDDFDEIEFMAPNTLGKTRPFHCIFLYSFYLGYLYLTKIDLPYQPPFDFELPDYKVLGKSLRNLAHSCPYDDSPSPPEELDIVISDNAISSWDMLKLPPLS